jgi:hypothetical protein
MQGKKEKEKKVYGETVIVDVTFVTQNNGDSFNFIIATQHLE